MKTILKIDSGTRDLLQGINQEDPILKEEGSWWPRDLRGIAGRHHKQTVVATTNEAVVFDYGHVVTDFTYETMYQ